MSGDPRDLNGAGDTLSTVGEEPDQDRAAILGWIYLGVIMAVFIAMALWAYNRSDDGSSTIIAGPDNSSSTTTAAPVLDPAVINVSVDRKVATLTGSVPDEGARAQLVRIAEDRFGNGNVVDDLTIDPSVDLATGTINVSGTADEDDLAPEQLQQNAGADLGLAAGAFDVEFVAPQFELASVDIVVGDTPVLLTGRVPTESDRDRLQLSIEAIYGEASADVSGVVVEPSDIDGALFTISGLTDPGDTRSSELVGILQTDFGSAVVSDDSEVDVSDEALAAFEEELAATLRERPILFESGTSQISDQGRENLLVIAEAIRAVPGRAVTITGHTDDTGGDTVNQTLSENRALSVKEALVDLGVQEERLITQGMGSSMPIVENNSAANRALNRRIEFSFERG